MPRFNIAFRVVDFHYYEVEADTFTEAKKKAQARADEHQDPERIVDGGLMLDEEASTFA